MCNKTNIPCFARYSSIKQGESFFYESLISSVPATLKIARSDSELEEIWDLRDKEFTVHYKEFSTRDKDYFDAAACTLYGTDQEEKITSTARVVFDGINGLPSDGHHKDVLDDLRRSEKILAEFSKLVISRPAKGMLRYYMKSCYELAVVCNVSSLIITCLGKSAGSYRRMVGAEILVEDIGYRFGTHRPFSLLEWDIKRSKGPLQTWLKEELV